MRSYSLGRHHHHHVICSAVMSVCCAAAIAQQDIHVAVDGNDAGNGTAAAAVSSLGRALQLAVERREPVTIWLHEGLHHIGAYPERLPSVARSHIMTASLAAHPGRDSGA